MLPIGIEIGSNTVKAVSLVKKGKEFFLQNYSTMPAVEGGITSDNKVDLEVLAEVVKKTWASLKTHERSVSMAINQLAVFTRVLEMPQMSDVELASSINWEAESYIPVPIGQVRMEWQIMKKYENASGQKRMDVLLMAVPRALVDKYYKIAELAGLELRALEPESIAIMRALPLFKLSDAYGVIINFGESKTDIIVSSGGAISFVRSLSTGGKALTRAIETSIKLPLDQAENYKIAYGFDKTKLNGAIYQVLMPIFNVVLEEIRRAIAFQQNKDSSHSLSFLAICGAGSNLPDLNVVLSSALNLEIVTLDPLSIIKPMDKKFAISSSVNQKFLVAAGLAMNEL